MVFQFDFRLNDKMKRETKKKRFGMDRVGYFSIILNRPLYFVSVDIDGSGRQHRVIKNDYCSLNHCLLLLKLLMIIKLFSSAFEPRRS